MSGLIPIPPETITMNYLELKQQISNINKKLDVLAKQVKQLSKTIQKEEKKKKHKILNDLGMY